MSNLKMNNDDISMFILDMFEADHIAGCGFYQDDSWRNAYLKLQKIVGYSKSTCVYDGLQDIVDE